MQIKKLERVLGRAILLRGPRHLKVTPAGLELLAYARRMLELQSETQNALFGPQLAGRVRLGVPDDYASSYLTPVLRSFASRHQGVEIGRVTTSSRCPFRSFTRGSRKSRTQRRSHSGVPPDEL